MHFMERKWADAPAALAASKALLDAGTDGIKVYAATWAPPIVALPESAIRAAVDEAHRRGKLVFAHPSNREGLLAAVRGGADILSARQILASMTTTPAERFGESARRGRLASGLAADLVVLSGDPFRDVRAFGAVRYTIRDGKVIYSAKN